jgi:flagellar biosynthesis/type III secretory pathway protein FliH
MSSSSLIKSGTLRLESTSRSPQVLPALGAAGQASGQASRGTAKASAEAALPAAPTLSARQLDEIEHLRAEALRKGHEEGYAKGLAEAQAQEEEAAQAQSRAVQALLNHISEAHRSELGRLESLAADFAFQATCRLVGEAYAQPELALLLVRQALAEVPGSSDVRIELHPADAAFVQAAIDELEFEHRHLQLSVIGSQQVSLGGCRLHTDLGVLDARLETQLTALKAQLDEARQP